MLLQVLLPIIFLLVGGGVYVGLTDPVINGEGLFGSGEQNIVELRQERVALEQALDDADSLRERADELNRKIQSISPDEISRLDDFLPDSVDDLQLVVDINNIAGRSNMRISDVELGGDLVKKNSLDNTEGGAPEVATVPVSFKVTGSYADFKSFLRDISRSLRILEVKDLEFASTVEGGATASTYTYDVTVETYWLK